MKKILIIEDDVVILRLYENLFTTEGFSVLTAQDGEVGVSEAAEKLPDLIILDIMMPKMDGLAVLDKLKSSQNTKRIPVIVLSNLGNEVIITDAIEKGAISYLKKSDLSNEALVAEVKKFI